ncbi:ER membrane protein complex subunit 4-like [Sycon ciliatum]|uniref:ER membrane protein complex subunit 4-like n=1 Tax=Sycon ciliatum TaxID=27933 RepID=UPI0020AE2FB5
MSRRKQKWSVDFTRDRAGRSVSTATMPDPVGFIETCPQVESSDMDVALIAKQSWGVAIGPLKQLPMNLLVMYMAGNTISIFPIMVVGMMLWRPLQTFFSMSALLDQFRGDHSAVQKLVFISSNILMVLIALLKCHSMGLLPTSPSDWLQFISVREQLEISGGGMALT